MFHGNEIIYQVYNDDQINELSNAGANGISFKEKTKDNSQTDNFTLAP